MPHHDAARGFDVAADAYERGRPGYPIEALDALAGALRVAPGTLVLDVGAGTGKLSRALAARGARVVALDPSDAMLRRTGGGLARARGVAEALPVREGALAAAVAASAFHWFDGPRALAELHRALRPSGRLALLWNVRDDAVAWVAALSEIVNRSEADAPRYRKGTWRDALERAPDLFRPVEERHFRHVHALPARGVVDRVASISFVARMPSLEREALLAEVRTLLATHPDTAGGGEVGLAYVTDLHVYERG